MARSLAHWLAPLACLLAAARAPAAVRELPPSMCGVAHYGSAEGSAQRLVETHLSPGVADWNIVVPMPPPCAEARVTGVDMRVCDADAAPRVSLSDERSARVHRAGQLASFAAVNVTVYCILPPATTAPPPTTQLIRLTTDSKNTYDASNELISYEVSSVDDDQEASDEPEPMPLVLTKLTTTAEPTPSTTLPPIEEQTMARIEPSLPIEVITPPQWNPPKENKPQSLKLTINITPSKKMSTEDDVSQSFDVELPLLSDQEENIHFTPSTSARFSSDPFKLTPSRISGVPREHGQRPRQPLPEPAPAPSLPPYPTQYPAQYPVQYPAQYPSPYRSQYPAQYRSQLPAQYPTQYPLVRPYPFTQLYSPLSLLASRLQFLQRPNQLLFFRHF